MVLCTVQGQIKFSETWNFLWLFQLQSYSNRIFHQINCSCFGTFAQHRNFNVIFHILPSIKLFPINTKNLTFTYCQFIYIVTVQLRAGLICRLSGISSNSSSRRIRDTHKKLMFQNHPDRGGSPYIAAKINEAKDYLEKNSNKWYLILRWIFKLFSWENVYRSLVVQKEDTKLLWNADNLTRLSGKDSKNICLIQWTVTSLFEKISLQFYKVRFRVS